MRLPANLLLTLGVLCSAWLTPALQSSARKPAPAPAWFNQHLQQQMAGGGRTVADNSDYMGPGEPAQAYGIQWSWGIGKRGQTGRLFAIVDGVEQPDAWQLRCFWHPGLEQVRVLQFGADGTYGEGWMRPLEQGGFEMEQTFYAPDGSQREVRHENSETFEGEHEGSSFTHTKDGWERNRTYIWRSQPSPSKKQR